MKYVVYFFLVLICACNDESKSETPISERSPVKEAEIKESVFTGKLTEHKPCSFKITLPSNFQLLKMYEDDSPDYCDYEVKSDIEGLRFEIHSMLKSRFSVTDVKELYESDLKEAGFEVQGSKMFEGGYFISGKAKDNHVYYLRKVGENFISDFYLEYPKEAETNVDMLIAGLYYKFESD